MADNVGYTPGTGASIAADDIGGNLYQRIKIGVGDDGAAIDVSASNPMPVLVNTATPLNVNVQNYPATQPVSGPVTDAQLRATPVPVSLQAGTSVTVDTSDLRNLLYQTVSLLDSPRGFDKSLQRQRNTVIIESGTVNAVSTVSTVSTMTNLSTIDGIQGRIAQTAENLSAWASCVRSRIS